MSKYNKFVIITLLFVLIVQSCSIDKPSLIEGNPCTLPCLYGITPGITNFDDAITALAPILNAGSAEKIRSKMKNNQVMDIKLLKETKIQMTNKNGYVWQISLRTDSWKISEVIELLGEPEYYLSFYQSREFTHHGAFLVYPKNGLYVSIIVDNFNQKTNDPIISSDTQVSNFTIMSRNSFYENLVSFEFVIQDPEIFNNFETWTGYGELDSFEIK